MDQSEITKNLLDSIRAAVGIEYLSDLREAPPPIRSRLQKAVDSLGKQEFSLNEWIDAVHYITGSCRVFSSVEDAEAFLSTYLKS